MKKKITFPDFINFQRESFYFFLKNGFINQFENRRKILSRKKNIELIFYPEKFKIKQPEFSTQKSIILGKSYTGKIFVPIQLVNKKKKKIKLQWVLLANIPLMTKRGHFILNGAPRIIISQIIRNPGIYLYEINKNKPVYYADFICYRGTWLRIEMDKKNQIWVKMKKIKKFSIFILLKSLGLSDKDIYKNIQNWEILHQSLLKEYHPKNTKEALSQLYEISQSQTETENELENSIEKTSDIEFTKYLNKKYRKNIKPGYKFLFRKLLNPRNYDLSKGGRLSLNKKLKLTISEKRRTLTAEDVLLGTNKLLELYNGKGGADDIDSLKNRRIRPSGEILENQIFSGITRLEKYIRERYRKNRKNLSVKSLISTKPINGALREFFGSSQLSQFMDQTNPLSELTHKRRATSIGPNGVNRETAGIAIRGIHSTHYGRICPIETPEGKNAGLVNSITTLAKTNSLGFIETPLYKVHKGQIQKNLNSMSFSAEIEEKFYIAPPDLRKTKLFFLPKKNILSRLGGNFKDIFYTKIDYISIFPIQLISIATSLIPFMEHNDGNRALMGSNMQRQAVPLLISERAVVGTGLESRIISDTGYSLQAQLSGYISYIGNQKIIIQKGFLKKKFIDLKKFINMKNFSPYKKNFFFTNYWFSIEKLIFFNQNNLPFFFLLFILQKNLFNLEYLNKKKILLKKNFFKKSISSFHFSSFFFKKKLKFHFFKKKIKKIFFIRKKEILLEFQRSNQETMITHKPLRKERHWVQKGDFLADGSASQKGELSIGKNLLIAYMPWYGYNFEDAILINERLIYNEIFTSIHISRFEIEIQKTKYGFEKFSRNIPNIRSSDILHLDQYGIVKIGSFIKEGDILVGKITPIYKQTLAPHEKLFYEIIGKNPPTIKDNSLRVPKGVKGKVINIQFLEINTSTSKNSFFNPKKIQIFIAEKRKIQVGDKISGRHGNKGIISKIIPQQNMPYLPDGTPVDIVLNPLGVPSRMNVGQVFECLFGLAAKELKEEYKVIPFDEMFGIETSRSIVFSKLYTACLKTKKSWLFNPNFPGKINLFDGYTGNSFEQKITTGYSYILKLIHLVDEKIHARSTGPYSLVTQQPLRGRSKHGGQRVGEMEVWALEGFGAAYILQELLTIKSDDMKGRKRILERILKNTPISFGTPESFKVLVGELQSLCLKISSFRVKEKQFNKKKKRKK